MNATTKLFAAILLAGAAGMASADSSVSQEPLDQQTRSTLTRAQVRADFLAARAAGELIEGPNGETARELNPARYPAAQAPAPSRTRAEVKRELTASARDDQLAASYYGN